MKLRPWLAVWIGVGACGLAGCRAHYLGSYDVPSDEGDGAASDASGERTSYADSGDELPERDVANAGDAVDARGAAWDGGTLSEASDAVAALDGPDASLDGTKGADAVAEGDASTDGDTASSDVPRDGDASLDADASLNADAPRNDAANDGDPCSMASLPDPLAYYSFDDCTDDRAALRDGTVRMNDGEKRGRVGCVPGHRGTAVFIDGAGTPKGYVNVPDAPAFRFTDQMTVSLWVSVLNSQFGHIASKWYSPDTFLLLADADLFHFSFAVPNPSDPVTPWQSLNMSVPMKLHSWVHLAGVFDRGVGRFYRDGTNDFDAGFGSSNTTSSIVLQNSDRPIQFGALTDEPVSGVPPLETFSGLIDEVRIYNVALSACQIRALAAQ
jgi:hypothetical protein